MRKYTIALAFYQNSQTASTVIQELRKKKFRHLAYVYYNKHKKLTVRRIYPYKTLFLAGLAVMAVFATFLSLKYGALFIYQELSVHAWIAAGFSLLACLIIWLFSLRIPSRLVNRYKDLVGQDEILVMMEINPQDVRETLNILRQVQTGHPVSFLLRSDIAELADPVELPKEPLNLEQLAQRASELAASNPSVDSKKTKEQPLLKHLEASKESLQFVHHDIADAEHIEQTINLSAEWLLDNMYVVEGSIDEVQRNLPKKFYHDLPRISAGLFAGYPRIYLIATEIVKGASARLTRDNIIEFTTHYQTVQPLTIGELWALPLMLRLRLVEWIQSLAIHVDRRMREGEIARFWGNRLLYAARREPKRLNDFLAELKKDQKNPSYHFAEELLDHLFDEETVIPLVRNWLEEYFQKTIDDVVREEQNYEATEQVVFSSAIVSLISLSQLCWRDIFEILSPVDAILKKDPINVYSAMDFPTRNRYRDVIELLARYSKTSQVDVANEAIQLASKGSNHAEQHVGYYLIDCGRAALQKSIQYKPPFAKRVRQLVLTHPKSTYFGGIGLITLLLEVSLVLICFKFNMSWLQTLLFGALALLPFSELAVQFMHRFLTTILHSHALPKMLYEHGIPKACKTLVVVPMMWVNEKVIKNEIERLEIRYLANTDPALCFSLFGDFTDASQQHMPEDENLTGLAHKGLQDLENKYGKGRFFLFYRGRSWSQCENAWIGEERKRGKLEDLNCFLMGEPLEQNILHFGEKEQLNGTVFVITLDADTQLPKSKAKELIEVLSHPLNRPQLAPSGTCIERGYTIIQPRVCTDFSNYKSSWFSRIFSEPAALDPYTQAVSNVYQDLIREGSYHGKGIYDLAAFHSILSHRFPKEHLLSHDLIEGAYVRVGLASDVCLFDFFPEDYLSWTTRKHRWMRGDFQILDWLLPNVPVEDQSKIRNPLGMFNRWKIFDNLRRPFVTVSVLALLICGWLFSPVAGILTALGTLVLFSSFFDNLLSFLIHYKIDKVKDSGFSLLRSFISTALLPQDSLATVDALGRVSYRRSVSRHHLLQWFCSNYGNRCSSVAHKHFVYRLGWSALFGITVFTAVAMLNPTALMYAAPFCLLWMMAPLIVSWMDKPIPRIAGKGLTETDFEELRLIARKTWRYFDDFVGPQSNWLPPDNYQIGLKVEIAQRTSPTNIGLWLLSVFNAYDLNYITCDAVIDKVSATIGNLQKLERFEGHFLNWYDIQTLSPLYPRYISTVDSGNLLACLWTLEHSLEEMSETPILVPSDLTGVKETCYLFLEETQKEPIRNKIAELILLLNNRCTDPVQTTKDGIKIVQEAKELNIENAQSVYWLAQIEKEVNNFQSLVDRYFGWKEILFQLSSEELTAIHENAVQWKKQIIETHPTLRSLATGEFALLFKELLEAAKQELLPADVKRWGKSLQEAVAKAQWFAGEKIAEIEKILGELQEFSKVMNLKFLFNDERNLFSIGYNIDDRRLDPSFYDLLASEARIASIVAIAKEDVPIEHWWALGRSFTIVQGRRVLLSWGGTMFEYLMPHIFHRHYPDSLMGETCEGVVIAQMNYGKKRGIPWGISESAFSAIDAYKTYQYQSFGVPGLGLKRGLEKDLVVSPYSSVLALSVNGPASLNNLKRMSKDKHVNMWGPFGFYESIDYTREWGPGGERGVIVYAYMAHHQGMALSAINNVINNDPIPGRFHKDPRISGVASLLYEKIPTTKPLKQIVTEKNLVLTRIKPFSKQPVMGVVETPESVTPKVNLLSNGEYSLMVTNAGGGYSKWRDFDITRWRADTTRDCWGSFYYIKDVKSGNVWSQAFQPTQVKSESYHVSFKTDKAEFKRRDHQIETVTEVVVSPEDNAEIHLLTLLNHSDKVRTIEITSYQELVLAPHATDRAHPAFNKMFIETEALPEKSALLAFRRLRSPDDQPLWAAHVVAVTAGADETIQYETDRSRFIGRGRSLQSPVALDGDLTQTVGTVLDPIFSLRKRLVIQPGSRVEIAYITAIADNRPAVLALVDKFKEMAASRRSIELAWTYGQLELRHLRIHQEEVQLFQKLASRMLYPHSQLRASEERLKGNFLGQAGLWAQGISGDLPICVVTVADLYDVDLVKQTIIAHAFWSLRGLKSDLVIINEEMTSYEHPLQKHLQRIIEAYAHRGQVEKSGGVYLKNSEEMPAEQLNLIFSVARLILVAARGSLRQQAVSPPLPITLSPKLIVQKDIPEEPTIPLPFLELPFFNGYGGYTVDGRNYVIYLDSKTDTPAPWINVIANPQFGVIASDAGLGCTWYGNSQSNRLTPWSNDPVIDPICDTIYIRDEKTGKFWTPTPAPVRELDPYRISHSQGFTRYEHNSHGIAQELLVFVPVDDTGGLSLRIQRLRLKNQSKHRRSLSVTAYSELVLGATKEETQINVMTEWDAESQALFAYNRYQPDFGRDVAFAASVPEATSFTGNRTEFIGRNRSERSPEALTRKSLTGKVGTALDPCAALQVKVELGPDAEIEIIFVLGYAPNAVKARELIAQCKLAGNVQSLFNTTTDWWEKTLGTIQVDLPDMAMNYCLNRWMLYQNLSCRIWARTAFYQSSGAYGFRDQLQDVMGLLYAYPVAAREQILRAASRQFVEGDVQHWWHPQSGGGVRTRFSDDLLWLPFVTAQYVRVTGDATILDEKVPFLVAPVLAESEHEIYSVPSISAETASILEHCRRAMHKGMTAGANGLPLIGGGDWNDGMNRVGIEGKGESVWLAWFLIHAMHDFAELLSTVGDAQSGDGFNIEAKRLAEVIENKAWDGEWYRRAYYDDGTPIGSKSDSEASIDSLAQSWAVISGLGDPKRIVTALNAAEKYLVKAKEKIVLLLTPPFDKTLHDPGYIKGYPPGVRENGGQYTHGSLWLAMAFARRGEGSKAAALLRMMHPISHTENKEACLHYKDEPYVLAADIYDLKGQVGRGGWTWYTGSCGWMYRVWLEEVLGFKKRGDKLSFDGIAIPAEWDNFKLYYHYLSSHYDITVLNPQHLSSGKVSITVDGKALEKAEIMLKDDQQTHRVEVLLIPAKISKL